MTQMLPRGSKPVAFRSWLFYSITASASKYFLHNQNILFLTEAILIWSEQSKSEKIEKF